MSFPELLDNEVYYNFNNKSNDKWLIFYIGNYNKFIMGQTLIYHDQKFKIKLEITIINSLHKYNIDRIVSNSYKLVDTIYYDDINEINLNEMIRIWNKYKDIECSTKFKYTRSFIVSGNLLNKILYKPFSLVDYIIYNKLIKEEHYSYVPFSPLLREKINAVYEEEIFDMDVFDNIKFEL